jgi:mono/diheme cytochrome c family protein
VSLRDVVAPLAAALVLVSAPAAIAFPWSTDMFRGASVQPLAVPPRVMPDGTLPMQGGEPPMSREEAATVMKNPLVATPAHLQRGEHLFTTHCAPCHGATGTGDGPVASHTIVPAANLTLGQPTERSDGYLYATIRNGSIVMPAYGHAMSSEERWQVVLYLRDLQRRAGP